MRLGVEVARQEAEAARHEDDRRRRQRDNQFAIERQTGGDGASKASGFVERTRGVATTSPGARGEREGRRQQTRGDGASKAGGDSRRRDEEEAARRKDERQS